MAVTLETLEKRSLCNVQWMPLICVWWQRQSITCSIALHHRKLFCTWERGLKQPLCLSLTFLFAWFIRIYNTVKAYGALENKITQEISVLPHHQSVSDNHCPCVPSGLIFFPSSSFHYLVIGFEFQGEVFIITWYCQFLYWVSLYFTDEWNQKFPFPLTYFS